MPISPLDQSGDPSPPELSLDYRVNRWPHESAGAPLLKLPSPSDYAKAAVFLASDDAEMITAFDLRVDAGAISRYWIWNPGDAAD